MKTIQILNIQDSVSPEVLRDFNAEMFLKSIGLFKEAKPNFKNESSETSLPDQSRAEQVTDRARPARQAAG